MTVLQSEAEGPVLFIVGGIHGDEAAGWMAADRLREEAALCRGTLYILSPANRIGAQNDTRATGEWGDLNRQFPGDSQGTPAQQLAAAIVGEIENASPVLVLDLHEAILKVSGRDFLGNSFIYSSLDGIDLLMMDLLEATRNGEICSKAFDYFGPGPDGSINLTVTEQLTIPVITVETYRAEPLEQRIQNQLDILHYVLRHYGMEAAS
jgi:predicted deacylase